jgi:hypothetical protein
VSDLGRAAHGLGLAGIELTPTTGTQEIRIDLASQPSGNHQLLRAGRRRCGS